MRKLCFVICLFLLASSFYATASDQNSNSLAGLPAVAQSSISAALGRESAEYSIRELSAGLKAINSHHELEMQFTASGVRVGRGDTRWGLALEGYGYGNDLKPVRSSQPRARANRVEYQRESLTEWYVNGPIGLEQGF